MIMYSGAATVLKKFALCALILLACMFVRGSSVLWDAFTSVHDNVDGDSIELNSNGFDVKISELMVEYEKYFERFRRLERTIGHRVTRDMGYFERRRTEIIGLFRVINE